ncbi:hypothetical protein GEMRC1_002217 [Eukaryota sp. GEM-RC1]
MHRFSDLDKLADDLDQASARSYNTVSMVDSIAVSSEFSNAKSPSPHLSYQEHQATFIHNPPGTSYSSSDNGYGLTLHSTASPPLNSPNPNQFSDSPPNSSPTPPPSLSFYLPAPSPVLSDDDVPTMSSFLDFQPLGFHTKSSPESSPTFSVPDHPLKDPSPTPSPPYSPPPRSPTSRESSPPSSAPSEPYFPPNPYPLKPVLRQPSPTLPSSSVSDMIRELQDENDRLNYKVKKLEGDLSLWSDTSPTAVCRRLFLQIPSPLHHLITSHQKAELLIASVKYLDYGDPRGYDVVFQVLFHLRNTLELPWFCLLLKAVPEAKRYYSRYLEDSRQFKEQSIVLKSCLDFEGYLRSLFLEIQTRPTFRSRVLGLDSLLTTADDVIGKCRSQVMIDRYQFFKEMVKLYIHQQNCGEKIVSHIEKVNSKKPENKIVFPLDSIYSTLSMLRFILKFGKFPDKSLDSAVIKKSFDMSKYIFDMQYLKVNASLKNFEHCRTALVTKRLFAKVPSVSVGLETFVSILHVNNVSNTFLTEFVDYFTDPFEKANVAVSVGLYAKALEAAASTRNLKFFNSIVKPIKRQRITSLQKKDIEKLIDILVEATKWRAS